MSNPTRCSCALWALERIGLTGVAIGSAQIRFDIHLQGERQTPFLVFKETA